MIFFGVIFPDDFSRVIFFFMDIFSGLFFFSGIFSPDDFFRTIFSGTLPDSFFPDGLLPGFSFIPSGSGVRLHRIRRFDAEDIKSVGNGDFCGADECETGFSDVFVVGVEDGDEAVKLVE